MLRSPLVIFQGLPKDGYDYNQHIRAIQPGGTFLTRTGELLGTDVLPGVVAHAAPVIPSDALPSETMVDRMLDSIVIREGAVPVYLLEQYCCQ